MEKCKKQMKREKWLFYLLIVLGGVFSMHGQHVITGSVTDDAGMVLPGVNVIIKGTSKGVVTDFDGKYSIQADNSSTLIFSYIGFLSLEESVSNRQIIDVQLNPSTEKLDEIVIIAYGTKKKRDVIGSVAKVEGKKIEQVASGSFEQGMQGLAAGVQVTASSGLPGQDAQIKIRGISSINSGTDPLWIVDGVGGGKGMVNPNDIESIEVLKDAAATAVYGARASNGVIIITTKKGVRGKPKFNLSYHAGVTEFTNLDMGYADTKTTYEIMDKAAQNYDGIDWDIQRDVMGNAEFSNWSEPITREQALMNNTNWNELLTRQGNYNDLNFSVSAGNENSNTYASVNYRKDEGNIINYDYERLSARINTEFYRGNLTYGIRMFTQYSERNGQAPGLVWGKTWMPVYSENNPTGYWNAETGSNPLANIDSRYRTSTTETFGLNTILFAKLQIPQIEGLAITANYNPTIGQSKGLNYSSSLIRQNGASQGNTGNESISTSKGYVANIRGNYNHTFGKNHNVDLLFGYEQSASKNYWTGVSGVNLLGAFHEVRKSTDPITGSSYLDEEAYRKSLFGRLDYKFMDRYLLGASLGREGSSKFVKDQRWGNFYSLSGGWIISDEKFLSADWISMLKLRGSIGQTGNDKIPNVTQTVYTTNTTIKNYAGTPNTHITNFGNPLASWETTTSADFGLDFGFMQNRLNGSIAFYQQNVSDMLLAVPLPLSAGLSTQSKEGSFVSRTSGGSYVTNIGDMKNSGIEIDASFAAMSKGDLKWTISSNVSFNKNEVTSLNPSVDATGKGIISGMGITRSGSPIGQYYMAESAGVDEQKGILMIYEMDKDVYTETGETVRTGNIIPASSSNIGTNRMIQEGKTGLPTYYGGVYNSFEYKNFDMSFNLTFQGGNYIFDDQGYYKSLVSINYTSGVPLHLLNNAWEKPGDKANFPELQGDRYAFDDAGEETASPNNLFGGNESRYLHKGDYARLKDITLGYSFPKVVIEKMNVSQFRLYLKGTNIGTITGYKNLDPEINLIGSGALGGASPSGLPPSRIYSIGINLSF
ncbi:SusC/RagA family TonB-linked outer membrane protein [Zobellia uliginosa]|uniref:SusC/RagA family TonB-linked outer membrane protein n=1 Tax=Zobellia uliginosa TaxID=143224 RepID=UPI0026E16ECF|nr:SusC/RagA family TonB-linked outer membrane protein [Zobellia uliginosa]MDO6519367.1 SusC/RagA family TonB-linked outer membrane protein [Zobellia uliginosa]